MKRLTRILASLAVLMAVLRSRRLLAPTVVLMACAMSTACAFSFRTVGSKDPTVEALRAVITALEQRLPPTPTPTPTPTPEAKQ